jgi:hypothetical protein
MGGVSFLRMGILISGAGWLARSHIRCNKDGMSIASPLHRARTGPWAGIGVALSLLAMLGTSMHVLLVEHELCDEHGALVEGDPHAVDTDTDATADAHDQDVHCPLAVASTASMPYAPDVLFEAPRVTVLEQAVATVDAPRFLRAVWRVAPKTSPPRA